MTRDKAHWKKNIAKAGEEAAQRYFQDHGAFVVKKNWRAGRFAEIDLILIDPSGMLIFAEVKSRYKKSYDLESANAGFDAIHKGKQHKIITSAKIYLAQNKLSSISCRLDVVVVEFPSSGASQLTLPDPIILHVPDAFHL